jgi:hypothetical protein
LRGDWDRAVADDALNRIAARAVIGGLRGKSGGEEKPSDCYGDKDG